MAVSTANAAIVPSWRINPINNAASAQTSLLSGAFSVSLMVTTTDGSSFGAAGLDLDGLFGSPAIVGFYQRVLNNLTPPDPGDFEDNAALEFDTYICGADPNSSTSVFGRLNGAGAAQIGQSNLNPPSGAHRMGFNFNVSWGGGDPVLTPGTYEIARITFGQPLIAEIPIPINFGLVTDRLDPGTNIPLPPIPRVPEPMSFALAGLGLLALRRK